MFLTLPNSLRRLARLVQTERPSPDRRRSFRPHVATLEHRLVLSTLTVTSSGDDPTDKHSLRYAVTHAQNGDTIQLTAAIKSPIVLTHGELVLNNNVTIESVPSRTPTISGDGMSRVFEISAGASVSLINLNLTGGNGIANNPAGSNLFGSFPVGGAILNLGTLTVSSDSVSGNASAYGGGIYNYYGGSLTVSGSTLSNNTASGVGGAIYSDAGASATITNSTLSGNTAVSAGGIDNDGTLTVSGSTLSGNSAVNGDGGAIFSDGVAATVSGSTLSGNSAQYSGGIENTNGLLTVSGSTLSDNSDLYGAGGIFNIFGTTQVSGSTLYGNSSVSGTGGIQNLFGTVSVSGSTLSGNSSIYGPGGLNNTFGLLTVSDSTVSGNSTSFFNAGGIWNYVASTMELTDTTITGNFSGEYGGAISNLGTATITGGSIDNNTASFGGGAIDNFLGSLTISGTTIESNTAGTDGGGIHNYAATLSVSDSTIADNTAERGGGIYNGGDINNGFGMVTVSGGSLANNSASWYGGAIFIDIGTSAKVTGSTVSGNSAAIDGGGIYNLGTLSVGTSDFSDNTPDNIVGGYIDLGGNTFM